MLGAVFNSRLLGQLKSHASPAVLKMLQGGTIIDNPAQIRLLPPAARTQVVAGKRAGNNWKRKHPDQQFGDGVGALKEPAA